MQPRTPRSYALAVPLRTGALELIVIKSDWERRTRALTREFKSRLLDLTTAPVGTVCAFDLVERRS